MCFAPIDCVVAVVFSIDRLNANEMERLTEAELEEARKPLAGNLP
jgi:hypothetical protein